MLPRLLLAALALLIYPSVFSQERFSERKDLRGEWMAFEDGEFVSLPKIPIGGITTIYFQLDPAKWEDSFLYLKSHAPYYLFVNGKVRGEYSGDKRLSIDSLLQRENRTSWVAIHQEKINDRDLETAIVSPGQGLLAREMQVPEKPYSHFRDFVVIAGFIIILLFLIAFRVSPKLAGDYFAISRIFSLREVDDSQAAARLTGGSNIQFHILCSLLVGYYLLIVLNYLPVKFALPSHFQASGFWMIWLQWLKLSTVVFGVLLLKLLIVFSLTRLFDMGGVARFHFFNWVRLLLVVLGAATIVLFTYFIGRGDRPEYYVWFLTGVAVILIAWIAVAFFKLRGRTEHSMFHLFSYLCATEIIPLLITVKVLYQ